MRYLVPVIFFAGAGFVWNYNQTHEGSWLLFPFLDLVPSLEGNIEAQAEWSWILFAGLGVLTLVTTILGDIRRSMKRSAAKKQATAEVDDEG